MKAAACEAFRVSREVFAQEDTPGKGGGQRGRPPHVAGRPSRSGSSGWRASSATGIGGSRAGAFTDFAAARATVIERMPGDVDAALKFLTAQATVNGRALGVVGGSCGVNQAVHASRRHPEIRTIVLLSGGTDAEGEAHIKSSSSLPVFGAASAEDTDAAASIKKIVGLSASSYSQLAMFEDAGHAASMFARQPDLEADIVIWFRSNLPVAGYGLPPAIR